MPGIKIVSGKDEISVDFGFLDNPAAKKIRSCLPLKSSINTWGDEIYFETDIEASAAGATTDVNVGDVAYWPEGRCLCLFFGRTPVSKNEKPVPASEVVVIGKAVIDPEVLRGIRPGSGVVVVS